MEGRSQVLINEYSAANWKQFEDNHSDFEDWIELYNPEETDVDISGYRISDDPVEPEKFQFPAGTVLPAHGFLVVWCSGRNRVDGDSIFHTSFKLTQTKKNPESLILSDGTGVILDSVSIQKTAVHHSRCRTEDGAVVWKICTGPTPGTSNTLSPQFTSYADRPDMDMPAGFYDGPVTVRITTDEPGGTIYFTLDGTEPTNSSFVYTGPILIEATKVIKARVYSNDPAVLPGLIRFNTYFIQENFTMPVVSIAADELLELANGDRGLRPIGSIEVFDVDHERVANSYGELNAHGQDSWINNQRSLDWISRDEMGYSKDIDHPLFHYSGRDGYQRVIFRAAGDDNYPATDNWFHEGSCHLRDDYVQTLAQTGGLHLDVRASERCVVFLNGRYWGVYSLRENPDDHDYTSFYYNQDKFDIQYLLTWGNTWAEYGGEKALQDWYALRDFILQHDMGDSLHYQKVADSIDLLSMIDYFLVNLNVVASDWLNYNTGWWRGLNPAGAHQKWGFILWDLDATFDYYINYSFVPNTDFTARPCDLQMMSDTLDAYFFINKDTCFIFENPGFPPDTFCVRVDGKHHQIFLKLLSESDTFRQLYYQRQSMLLNTVFSCDRMMHVLDSMVAIIEPEMPAHIQRWGGTMGEWRQNVAKLRTYIGNRCQYYPSGMLGCYDELKGPYPVTLLVEPADAGQVVLNTQAITSFPSTVSCFGGMENHLQAVPDGDRPFDHWESRSGAAVFSDPLVADATVHLAQADTLVAVFGFLSSDEDPREENKGGFTVYPTVLKDGSFNVTFPEDRAPSRLTVYSPLGIPVASWSVPSGVKGGATYTLPPGLPAGMYLVLWQAGQLKKARKIVLTAH